MKILLQKLDKKALERGFEVSSIFHLPELLLAEFKQLITIKYFNQDIIPKLQQKVGKILEKSDFTDDPDIVEQIMSHIQIIGFNVVIYSRYRCLSM